MKISFLRTVILAGLGWVVCPPASRGAPEVAPVRVHESFDRGWRFTRGDVAGAEQPGFDDSAWRRLDLPHDWSIEGPYDAEAPTGAAGGYLPTGIGWYRKQFKVPAQFKGRLVTIHFDGVYMDSTVWINGHKLGGRPYGYVSFHLDLAPYLGYGEAPNVIAVRVDNSRQPNSRWYSGSGIYRHVWLTTTNALHLASDGVFVTTPAIGDERATVTVQTEVVNETGLPAGAVVAHEIRRAGRRVDHEAVSPAVAQFIAAGATSTFTQTIDLPNPALWSPASPALYQLTTEVRIEGRVVDRIETTFGVRRLEFSSDTGFSLNGRNLKLQGMCLHHEAGPVGAAVPEDVWRRRLRLLQQMGCNAIRTSHNPMAAEFYTLCDEMGLLVMGEILDEWRTAKPQVVAGGYHRLFADWAVRDVQDAIRRDRNHPCVFMWSVGNEVLERGQPQGVADARRMVAAAREVDPSRPVTCGIDQMAEANASGFADAFDVTGYNDGGGSVFLYDTDRSRFPHRMFIGTEHPHGGHTRGVYRTTTTMTRKVPGHPPQPDLAAEEVFPEWAQARSYASAYDNNYVWISIRDSWRLTASRPFIMGEFRWAGIDYLGEARWPARANNGGVLDLAGFPKDVYYLYQSLWTRKPMVHLLPHWTHPGKEGAVIPVVAWSNTEEVELFQDGCSLGRQPMTLDWQIKWRVPYRPGELRAVAYRAGVPVAEFTERTAGPARRLRLELDRTALRANGRDVVHATAQVLDGQGLPVPQAANRLTFTVRGPLRLLGTENGDTIDPTPALSPERRAFMGLGLAIYQATNQAGTGEITVTADGLEPAAVEFLVKREEGP